MEVAERFADGTATAEEMLAAHDAAYVAVDDCLNISVFSEDQANAAYLAAAAMVDERLERYDPFPGYAALHAVGYAIDGLLADCEPQQAALLRDIFGNPFRSVTLDPAWRTSTVVALAKEMYESRDFSAMPILADALQDAGCDNDDVLNHCRDEKTTHVRGCWVVDLVLGKS